MDLDTCEACDGIIPPADLWILELDSDFSFDHLETPLLYLLYELSRICKPYVAHQSRNLGQFLTVRTFSIHFPCRLSFPLRLSHKNISFRSCPQGCKLDNTEETYIKPLHNPLAVSPMHWRYTKMQIRFRRD